MCAEALEREIQFQGPDTVAGFIAEPVMNAAGVLVPPPEYFPRIRQICDRYGVLLIMDEVITGFGRTGRMFACEHWNVTPDMLALAKAITSGYFPVGAAVVREGIARAFDGGDERRFYHGHTYGGHPVGAVAALANIEIIEDENLAKQAAETGSYLLSRLKDLERHRIVGDTRGLGLFLSVELVQDKASKTPFDLARHVGETICRRACDLGVITRSQWDKIILCPPLVITRDQVDRIVDVLDRAIGEVESGL